MCGIAGQVSAGGADAGLVQRMCDVIEHRGPDGEGRHVDGDVAIAMRRLAIIDVGGGQQPIFNEDGTVAVVFNGEIYNYPELRQRLIAAGHTFRTHSDTEVIAHLYEDHGNRCVEHLRGMFAFAVWDATQRLLLLARDRAGKKPLYYRANGTELTFGSELKTLLQDPTFDRTVDLQALDHYLTFQYVPAPWSIISGIQKLPPAHTLTYVDGRCTLRRYWELSYAEKTTLTEPEAVERLRELILESTRIRMVSERPLGAFLSGGVDSSLVVAAMATESSVPVRTFSIGFEDQAFDEREYARRVAERYGTEHHELVVRPDAATVLERLSWFYDEPFADSSAVPTYYVSELAKEHVTVALNGDGGDESFGGYRRYAANLAADRLPDLEFLRPAFGWLHDHLPADPRRGLVHKLSRASSMLGDDAQGRYLAVMSYFNHRRKQELYAPAMRRQLHPGASVELFDKIWWDNDAQNLTDRMLATDVASYLPGDLLVKVDIATMANSLEGRSPLLDHHVMEFAASLPPSWKVRRGTTKYLLKEAGRGWLPDDILDRPKMGFGVPIGAWFRSELRDMAWDLLTDATASGRGYFDPAEVRRLLTEHASGHDHSPRLWALLQLELWHRTWLDRKPTTEPPALPGTPR